MKRYPIGLQTFSEIIKGDYVYIDKTELIYNLISKYNYVFLSRPRRFGKSLLVSTLASYFEGEKELFKGLAIEKRENKWIKHPVLRFDFSSTKMYNEGVLLSELNLKLQEFEIKWGKNEEEILPGQRLNGIIRRAYEKTGQKVVVLIDEYDAPILNVMEDQVRLNEHRQIIRDFYAPIKMCDPYIRFVFITGITKFAQVSIFSELNNLKNISMLPEYAAICGITEDEITGQMVEGLTQLAQNENITLPEAIAKLKEYYDGYHFTYPSPDIFNPFSLLNALNDKAYNAYWFESGTPSFLLSLLSDDINPKRLSHNIEVKSNIFNKPLESEKDTLPLLYQSGYLTIKDYDKEFGIYSLALPNKEVQIGLFETLLPYYINQSLDNATFIEDISRCFKKDDIDTALRIIQRVLSSIPQCNNTNYEGHYQSLFCLIFVLTKQYLDTEVRTSRGRVDVVINNKKTIYLIEIKLNKSSEEALGQINLNDYASHFSLLNLPIVKVGVNFSSKTHTIDDWKIE